MNKISRKEIKRQLAAIIKDWDDLTESNRIAWICAAEIAVAETGHLEVPAHKNIYGQLRYIEV